MAVWREGRVHKVLAAPSTEAVIGGHHGGGGGGGSGNGSRHNRHTKYFILSVGPLRRRKSYLHLSGGCALMLLPNDESYLIGL
ncbi:hypothetical protein NL676_017646 [Syzygium grande]|nr:hypothetical protein NL676_017646 [Syzygium grande]